MPWSTLSDAPIDSRLTPHVSATARFRLRVCEGTASPRVRFVSVTLRAFTRFWRQICCRPAIHPVVHFRPASDAKFCELGLLPAAGAEFQRKQSNLLGKLPFPLVDSTPERSKAGLTYH